MAHIVVTALGGGVQPRLEINTFVQNDRFFSLYVQALTAMQQVNQNQTPSWYQVSGIHGFPFIAYNGANANGFQANPSQQWAGYCTHGSTLFPTWHRPYVMLVEQIINQHAQQIAGTYTTSDKAQWVAAATNLRQPYWDWAENIVPPPQVISLTQVEITMPNGQRKNVTNPLKTYKFNPMPSNMPNPYRNWPTTLRQPTSRSKGATDNVQLLKNTLSNSQQSTTTDTFNMLTRISNWAQFSNHDPTFGSANSLESIHDNIHVLVGGNGEMSDPTVAAFDPIFFLHHSNVDRMLALWSALHPGVWVSQGNVGDGTWTLRFNQTVDASTSLAPFWKTQSTFWLSTEATNINTLQYTYPEFQGVSTANAQQAIAQKVSQLYGPSSPPMSKRSVDEGALSMLERRQITDPVKRHNELASRGSKNRLSQLLGGILSGQGGHYSDWNARVIFKRTEAGGSFSVIFFLGSVPEDPSTWLTCSQFMGAHHAFVHSMECSMCDEHKSMEEGFVSLNPALASDSSLKSLLGQHVAPLLTDKLQWRVLKTDGTVVNLTSLQVEILEVPVHFESNNPMPTTGNVVSWSNITQGHDGRH